MHYPGKRFTFDIQTNQMKKFTGLFVFASILIFVGYFWIKSHDGDEDVIRAKRTIETENRNIEDAKKRY